MEINAKYKQKRKYTYYSTLVSEKPVNLSAKCSSWLGLLSLPLSLLSSALNHYFTYRNQSQLKKSVVLYSHQNGSEYYFVW